MVTQRLSDQPPRVRNFSSAPSDVRLLVHVGPGDDVLLHLAALAQIVRGYGRSTTSGWGWGAIWRWRRQRAAAMSGAFLFAFDAATNYARG